MCFLLFLPFIARARDDWSELNIGPFKVDYQRDESKARQTLADLEQLRWILGGMLESKSLEAVWPFRILITNNTTATGITFAHGENITAIRPSDAPPMREIARILIEENTPRLPAEVDSVLPVLFDGFTAHGSRATWAIPPAKPDINWARLHLFVTKPDYADRFPVFLNNLRGGAPLSVAEANAFGKDSKSLEAEAAAHLAAGNFQPITTSARPLDPKRDFGQHSFDPALANLYLADTELKTNSKFADQAFKTAVESGYRALGQEGFALLVLSGGGDPREYLDNAISASSRSAWVFVQAAQGEPVAAAKSSLENARNLNPKWWIPSARLAELATAPAEKESLLLEACTKNPRSAELWQSLAELQSSEGKVMASQNSWIRAEDAAATPETRAAIEKRKEQAENQRLDAEDKARRDARNAEVAADQKAQDNQMARIRAAEQKANQANLAAAQPIPTDVIPWWNPGEKPLEASLVRVDCLDGRARLSLRIAAGKLVKLLVTDSSHLSVDGTSTELGCGVQEPTRRLSVTFKPRPDRQFGTSGDVIAVHFE